MLFQCVPNLLSCRCSKTIKTSVEMISTTQTRTSFLIWKPPPPSLLWNKKGKRKQNPKVSSRRCSRDCHRIQLPENIFYSNDFFLSLTSSTKNQEKLYCHKTNCAMSPSENNERHEKTSTPHFSSLPPNDKLSSSPTLWGNRQLT